MRVTIVGCSGSFGGPGNPCSCYLIEHGRCRVVVDLGNGALGELQRYGSIYDIDAVILSHLHADHFVDLCGYYVARKWRPGSDGIAPLDVWGPSGTSERIAKAYDVDTLDCESVFRFHDLMENSPAGATENSFGIGPFTVTVARVRHPVEAFAIRLTVGDKVFVYSGDTAPCSELDRLASAADLYLAEAAFQEPRDDAVSASTSTVAKPAKAPPVPASGDSSSPIFRPGPTATRTSPRRRPPIRPVPSNSRGQERYTRSDPVCEEWNNAPGPPGGPAASRGTSGVEWPPGNPARTHADSRGARPASGTGARAWTSRES